MILVENLSKTQPYRFPAFTCNTTKGTSMTGVILHAKYSVLSLAIGYSKIEIEAFRNSKIVVLYFNRKR
jgi:hypothetical protein